MNPPDDLRPTPGECAAQLEAVKCHLAQNDWQPAYDIWDLLRDAVELELYDGYALERAMFASVRDEIRPEHYAGHRPPQLSDIRACPGAELFAFAWNSAALEERIYFKFCFFRGALIIHSFHKERRG